MVRKQIQNTADKGWDFPEPIHPGEHLEDFLLDTGLSQAELAERVGLTKKAVNEIIKGKNPITDNTAFRLSKIFAVSPEFWMNLQNDYDAKVARQEEVARLAHEAERHLPNFRETYKELVRLGAVKKLTWNKNNLIEITRSLQSFFLVGSLVYVEEKTMNFAFRKYDRSNLNPYTLAAWVQLGKRKATKTKVEPFDKAQLRARLTEIKKLSQKPWQEYVVKLEAVLAECGVVLVYAPKMKNSFAQGATHWIDSDTVLLMLNTYNQDEGKFWFNLFHELGHILLHGKKNVYIDFENGERSQEEEQADAFANKWLTPHIEKLDVNELVGDEKEIASTVNTLAKKNDVSPAIIAGRLTHEHRDDIDGIYSLMNPFLKERIQYTNL